MMAVSSNGVTHISVRYLDTLGFENRASTVSMETWWATPVMGWYDQRAEIWDHSLPSGSVWRVHSNGSDVPYDTHGERRARVRVGQYRMEIGVRGRALERCIAGARNGLRVRKGDKEWH